jgi:hypothetical protein
MFKSDKIVRTRSSDNDNGHYTIKLMYYKDYARESKTIIYGQAFELYPYKWYDLRWLYQKPLLFLSLSRNLKNVKTPPTKAHQTIKEILIALFVSVLGGLMLWLIVSYFEK